MISVVIRPFKSGGVFYPAGTLVDPAGITLYRSKIGENKIAEVDEHNLDEISNFLQLRYGIDTASTDLTNALNTPADVEAPVEDMADDVPDEDGTDAEIADSAIDE